MNGSVCQGQNANGQKTWLGSFWQASSDFKVECFGVTTLLTCQRENNWKCNFLLHKPESPRYKYISHFLMCIDSCLRTVFWQYTSFHCVR